MSDTVERLQMDILERLKRHYPECWDEAAAEIERLRALLDAKISRVAAEDVTVYGTGFVKIKK
jgi:hypothetical protein